MEMNQTAMIQEYMERFGSISPVEAYSDLGCMRLGARIADLKKSGLHIDRKMETRKNRYGKKVSYARYYIIREEEKC